MYPSTVFYRFVRVHWVSISFPRFKIAFAGFFPLLPTVFSLVMARVLLPSVPTSFPLVELQGLAYVLSTPHPRLRTTVLPPSVLISFPYIERSVSLYHREYTYRELS